MEATEKVIKITFPVKKKNKDDTYRTTASYVAKGDKRYFCLKDTTGGWSGNTIRWRRDASLRIC